MPNGIGSRIKTGSCQTGQLPGRIKSELCDLSGLRIDLISRLLSLSRLYSGILHSLSLSLPSLSFSIQNVCINKLVHIPTYIYIYTYKSLSLSVQTYTCLHYQVVDTHTHVHLCLRPSIHPSIHPCIHPSIHPCMHTTPRRSICPRTRILAAAFFAST